MRHKMHKEEPKPGTPDKIDIPDHLRGRDVMVIPVPTIAPLGVHLDKKEMVQEVWDAIVKPQQESGELQSAEDRGLMGILRAVYEGLM